VIYVDEDAAKIDQLRAGKCPIFDPFLDDLIVRNAEAGRLSFATESAPAVRFAEAIFIAVGTPSRRGDGFADLSFVYEIAAELDGFTVIATKSPVPVDTGDEVDSIVRQLRPKADFAVVSNPEFLREGAAIEDFKHPDRVVVGTEDDRACRVMTELYPPLCITETPILFTGGRTAELIKYAANAFLATKITFINERAELCERVGANVQEVARGMGLDGRIGSKFLHAGPGFGGSCFRKDTSALAAIGQRHGAPVRIVEMVIGVNNPRKAAMVQKIVAACGGSVRGKRLAVLGLAFKPNTDDMRARRRARRFCQSWRPKVPMSGPVIRRHGESAQALAGGENRQRSLCLYRGRRRHGDPHGVDQFRALDLDGVKAILRKPVVVDLRNVYRTDDMAARRFALGARLASPRSQASVMPK
jgi:UDPglucose 6-dehydrogenase